jgi:hypothetical protein
MDQEGIRFRFGNREIVGKAADTIATALLRNGIHVFDRSVKRRRKRGAACLEGYCMSCMVEVNGEADVLACRTRVEPGMVVKPQVAWPSPKIDFRAPLQQTVFELFGQDLYYRLFTRPTALNELWVNFLAKMSGRGKLANADTSHSPLPMKSIDTQILIIGGGVAGVSAAYETSKAGLEVLLIDRGKELGGWWHKWNAVIKPPVSMGPLKEELPFLPTDIRLMMNTTLIGLYEGNMALAIREDQALRIHYEKAVIAAGCYPKVIRYLGSDEPTHLPAQGLLRAAVDTGWFPPSVVVLDFDGMGSLWADTFRLLGSEVRHCSMEGPGNQINEIRASNGAKLSGVKLITGKTCRGTVVCWSAGWYPKLELVRQTGGQVNYSASSKMFIPVVNNKMEVSDNVYVVGGSAGNVGFDAAQEHGSEVGRIVARSI